MPGHSGQVPQPLRISGTRFAPFGI
jgi:hypothetical protein